MSHRSRHCLALFVLVSGTALPAFAGPWLALCAKCLNPTVFRTQGLDTAHAVAEARITREAAAGWCENWEPGRPVAACVAEQMAGDDAKRIWRAEADCTAGRITPVDGATYTFAGVWRSDVGRGRTRWRDAQGRIVGQDNASGGLGIAQQWEVLCPRTGTRPGSAGGRAPVPAPQPGAGTGEPPPANGGGHGSGGFDAFFPAPAPAPEYRVGQAVEAKYLSDWLPARIEAVRPARRGGFEYDVRLANGKRGAGVPPRLLRPAP
ncbi:hypothetical protein [Plasticicumulans sp.]|uniref:hypothetical protein n=1 Tax=Plasticicumulans sp. TaxID=2307179 RepID=UPI003938465A